MNWIVISYSKAISNLQDTRDCLQAIASYTVIIK